MAVISLQGGMAVGKTSLTKRIQLKLNNATCCYEYQKRKPFGLNMFIEDDYYKIQSYFIRLEIERYSNLPSGNIIIDLGPEEIEFYTLYFPKSIGANWNVEEALSEELEELRRCNIDGILYLDADKDTLKQRKEGDLTRNRGSFENYLMYLHPNKKKYFEKKSNTTILNVDNMSLKEVEDWTIHWLEEKWNIS